MRDVVERGVDRHMQAMLASPEPSWAQFPTRSPVVHGLFTIRGAVSRRLFTASTNLVTTYCLPMSISPHLLLLPGLAADERMWRGVLPLLPAALRPEVATAHQDVNLHRIEDFAARLLAQHAGPLVLAGASMGGMVAMEAARQAPQRVAGLALLGTTARPETPDMRALREGAIELFEQGRLREVIEPNVALAFHPVNAAKAELVQA